MNQFTLNLFRSITAIHYTTEHCPFTLIVARNFIFVPAYAFRLILIQLIITRILDTIKVREHQLAVFRIAKCYLEVIHYLLVIIIGLTP